MTTPLWSLKYDKSVWTLNEEDMETEEDSCYANLQVADPDNPEEYLMDVEISVVIDEPYDFREDLIYYGFDQQEYKVNNSYDLTKIGGVELLKYEKDETLKYFNRVENAGATVDIEINAEDVSDSRIAALLDGLTVTLTDTGNVDGPWEWDVKAFETEDHTATAGAHTLSSKFIPLDKYISTFETFNHGVAAVNNTVYILTEGVLKQYAYNGSALSFEKDITLPDDDYKYIQSTADGRLWLCGSMNDVICLKDGAVTATYEDLDNVAIHPSGSWGVSYFVNNECKKVTFSGNTYTEKSMTFKEADTISRVIVDDKNIYVCASAADDSGHKVFIYNADGVLQKTLCDAEGEGLGSITYIAQTAKGWIGFDGNMRDVMLWNPDGSLGQSILNTFKTVGKRFTYGGDTGKDQRVYYFNTKELIDNKFGTPNPIPFRVVDSKIGLDIDVSVRCSGVYSYKIADPLLFYTNVCGNVEQEYTRDELEGQLKTEFISALQPAFGKLSELELRPNQIVSHNTDLENAMNVALSAKWGELRGLKIVSIALGSVTLPEEDAEMIKQAQRTAIMRDPTMAAATLVGAQADAMKAAASNEAGAMNGFVGMGMAMNAGGGMNAQNLFAMGQNQPQPTAPAANTWTCGCGATVSGKFCTECGAKKPSDEGWQCSCGAVNKGKFCAECGAKKPEGAPQYQCDKCGWTPEDPFNPPKFCPECGDLFDERDKK